jgi:ribosomal protein S18 acetylase RimI-like enzyme
MSWTIRAGQSSDLQAVLSLWASAGAEPTHTDDRESLAILLEHDQSALLVADNRGRIVGSVIAAWDGWRGSIYRLAVDPSERRHGLGGQLLRAAESWLSAQRAVRIQAIVVESDANAIGFWRSSGWEEQIERLRFVKG